MQVRQCWICFGEEEVVEVVEQEDNKVQDSEWARPCLCRGTTQWVHQSCLLSWLDSRHGRDRLVSPRMICPQCHAPYKVAENLIMPRWMLTVLDKVETATERTLIYASICAVATGTYLISFTYGLGVVAAILGPSEMWRFVEIVRNPLATGQSLHMACKLMFGVPLVPLYVLSVRYPFGLGWLYPLIPALVYEDPSSLRWGLPLPASTLATVLPLMTAVYGAIHRAHMPSFRRWLVPNAIVEETVSVSVMSLLDLDSNPVSPRSNFTLTDTEAEEGEEQSIKKSLVNLASLMLFPLASAAVGYLLFGKSTGGFNRSVMGGAFLVLGKDFYLTMKWYQQQLTMNNRRVLDRL